ncbi:MAG: sulfite exporter TauE/SafE family protein [Acidobacteriota bacterium]
MSLGLDLALFAAGFGCWAISTFSAGGGSLMILAVVSLLLGGQGAAPAVAIASFVAGPARMAVLWSRIDWSVVRWYAPGDVLGAAPGAWVLSRMSARWIELVLALFLVSTLWQFRLGARARSFRMQRRWFVPVSFCSGLVSGMVGASGLLVNPFYLNYGLEKERLLATRAVNSTVIQIVKIAAYTAFGVLSWPLARYGLAAGAGAAAAIVIANPWLARLTPRRFRQLAVLAMFLGGLAMLWKQRHFLAGMLP